jgi:hypothetical protein
MAAAFWFGHIIGACDYEEGFPPRLLAGLLTAAILLRILFVGVRGVW